MKIVECVKILGVRTSMKSSVDPDTRNEMWQAVNQVSKFVNKNTSLRARAINIETFVLSKIIFRLRHFTKMKTFLKKLNSRIADNFWQQKKHNVSQDVLHTDRKKGGIGLKNLSKAVSVAKILNIKVTLAKDVGNSFHSSKWFKALLEDLKKENIELTVNADGTITVHHFFSTLSLIHI